MTEESRQGLIILRHDGKGMTSWLESWVKPRQATQNILGRERGITVWECLERVRVVCPDGVSEGCPQIVGSQPNKFQAVMLLAERRANILRREQGWRMVR